MTTQPTGARSEGAVVVSIAPGSAAEAAGIREGDVITALDGEPISDPSDLAATIAGFFPGDEVTVTIERDGNEQQLSAELGAHEESNS